MFDHLAKNTIVPLLLRLGLAAIFLYHGGEKVFGAGNDLGFDWARSFPNPPPKIAQFLVAWGELLGGAAMLLGLLTRVAAVGIAIIMVGAIVTTTAAKGFSVVQGGFEYNLLIIIVCAALFLMGAGTISADRFLRWRKRVSHAKQ
jgi:putative oxidoreductase